MKIAGKTAKCLTFCICVMASILFISPSKTYASQETSDNYVKKIKVEYIGEHKDVGDTLLPADFSAIGVLKDGDEIDLESKIEYDNLKLTAETTKITASYTAANGKILKRIISVKADELIKGITAELDQAMQFDAGDKLTTEMFTVYGKRKNGEKVVLPCDTYSLSTKTTSKDSRKTNVTITYKNSLKTELQDKVTISSDNIIKDISAEYIGQRKDIGEGISTDEIDVTGTTYNDEIVQISNFTISPTTVEKASNKVQIIYTDSIGKEHKTYVTVLAGKLVKSIDAEYVGASKIVGSTISTSEISVVGTTIDDEQVAITNFTMSETTITKESQKITIQYVNTAGNTLSAKVEIDATNYVTTLTVEPSTKVSEVGDSISSSDFKVTATRQDGSNKKLSASVVELANDIISVDANGNIAPIGISYTNDNGSIVTAQFIPNARYVTGISAVCKEIYTQDDLVSPTDFLVYVNYNNGNRKKLNKSQYTLDKTSIKSSSDVITIGYTHTNGNTFYTQCVPNQLTWESTIPGAKITENKHDAYVVGGQLNPADFTITAPNKEGKKETAIKVNATGGRQLKNTTNKVTLSFTLSDGTKGEFIGPVKAKDYVKSISAVAGTGSFKEGDKLNKSNIDSAVIVTLYYKSGDEQKLTSIKNCAEMAATANTGKADLLKNGEITLSGNSKENGIVLTYTNKETKTAYASKCFYVNAQANKVNKLVAQDVTLEEGKTMSLSKVITSATKKVTLTGTTDNKEVATVNSSGKLVAKSEGTCTLIISAKKEATGYKTPSVTCKVKVTKKPAKTTTSKDTTTTTKKDTTTTTKKDTTTTTKKLKNQTITGKDITLKIGVSKSAKDLVSGEKGTVVIESCTNPAVVHVANGKITAKTSGTAVIKLYAKETSSYKKSNAVNITVTVTSGEKPVNNTIRLTKSSVTLTVGDKVDIKTYIANGTLKSATSSNTKIVSALVLNGKGNIGAISKGSATVTFTGTDGSKATLKVTVKEKTKAKQTISVEGFSATQTSTTITKAKGTRVYGKRYKVSAASGNEVKVKKSNSTNTYISNGSLWVGSTTSGKITVELEVEGNGQYEATTRKITFVCK